MMSSSGFFNTFFSSFALGPSFMSRSLLVLELSKLYLYGIDLIFENENILSVFWPITGNEDELGIQSVAGTFLMKS